MPAIRRTAFYFLSVTNHVRILDGRLDCFFIIDYDKKKKKVYRMCTPSLQSKMAQDALFAFSDHVLVLCHRHRRVMVY